MARFLSADWFAEIASQQPRPAVDPGRSQLVLVQVVHGTPDGEVRYRVVAASGTAYIEPLQPIEPVAAQTPDVPTPDAPTPPDLTIACDWATAAAMAQGQLSAQAALMAGRLRVRGSLSRLSGWAADLIGLDPVPPDIRRRTTY